MSIQLVKKFQKRLEDLIHHGGTHNETSVRAAFQTLLSEWAEGSGDNLRLIPELSYPLPGKKGVVRPDGTVQDSLQQARGYWESKDTADTLQDEVQKKFAKGYPRSNIIFEDSTQATLIQHGEEVMHTGMDDAPALARLLTAFFAFVPPEVTQFRRAIESFKAELPGLLTVLRNALSAAEANVTFKSERDRFVDIGRKAMNPEFSAPDAGEMLIQHILTGEIFRSVFDNAQYFEENNIAQQLERLAHTFYVKQVRRDVETLTRPYYGAIKAAASKIADHHEKQKFLKVLYENFYRAYNPAAAEKLGIFYTPGEIVRFMIEATDTLLERHFGKGLADKGVEILDPATGTGTFITELIDFLPKSKLAYKYEHELHCNELALLPYYIANLNIEATYEQKMGNYAEFRNIVLVDTLDNTGFGIRGESAGLFESLSAENLERVKRQNDRPLKVIIGNPPYRANQANENDNNKNREYKLIDKRIKDTYIAQSTAQKTKLYDMYSRFLRWATDRLKEDGIVAFVMNRSFIDSRTFDGFRKVAVEEYTHIYVIDLGGDVRANPKLSGPKHNVFAIQTGVAIAFLVKQTPTKAKKLGKPKPAEIQYARRPELETAREKLAWLVDTKFEDIDFEHIRPDNKNNWIDVSESDWEEFMPLASKDTKQSDGRLKDDAIFKIFTLGVSTNRDEWVYSLEISSLNHKTAYLSKAFNVHSSKKMTIETWGEHNDIKWSETLNRLAISEKSTKHSSSFIIHSLYRPYCVLYYYSDPIFSDRLTENHFSMFGDDLKQSNNVISVRYGDRTDFCSTASKYIPNLNLYSLDPVQCLPLYRYTNGQKIDNITDFALKAFRTHYADSSISREDIFHYVYAVLHHPAYREKYALNLRQEFPRVPFYPEFKRWVAWGAELMRLHIDFETVPLWPLNRTDSKPKNETPEALAMAQKARLKADKVAGSMTLDGLTTLHGVPEAAWQYRLGNRSALEWVLERHKETTPKDATIREHFNTYRFADHKERVIELLARVTTVSVETMRILGEMPAETL